jgi:O-methyltransferase
MTVDLITDSTRLDAAHKGLAAARTPQAHGPGPETVALRHAYLDLLKLCLCDLVGTSTVSVGRTAEGVVASRELVGEQLRLRAAGMDWPLQGLTMVGLDRLDDLQSCVESVVRDRVEGDLIEAGTWRGGAAILMRAALDALGELERTVWVADSFQGFPQVDQQQTPHDQWGEIDYLSVPLNEVKANFARLGCDQGVRFLAGFFADTLADLVECRWSVIRLDGDTYDATWCALESLYPGLSVGGYLIIDDYGALEECRAAVDEFRGVHGIDEPIEPVDWTCIRWRRETESPITRSDPAPVRDRPHVASVAVPAIRRPPSPVPSLQELALTGELDALRERLAAAEAELQRRHGVRLGAAGRWLRDRLSRGRAQ